MQCLQCQYENREGLKFCNQCGTLLSGHCAQCGFANESGSKFCGECGKPLIATTFAPDSVHALLQETELERRFQALIPGVMWRLQRDRRITYRTLKYAFGLDEPLLGEIKEELFLIGVAREEGGKVLVWTGVEHPTAFPMATGPGHHTIAVTTPPPSPTESAPLPLMTTPVTSSKRANRIL